jgi:hypothetical protein
MTIREKNLLAHNNNEDLFFSKGKLTTAYPSLTPEERLRRIVILNMIRKIQRGFRLNKSKKSKFAKSSINNMPKEGVQSRAASYQNTQEKGKLHNLKYIFIFQYV